MPPSKKNNPTKPNEDSMKILSENFNSAQKSSLDFRTALINIKDLVESNPELYTSEEGLMSIMKRFLIAPIKKDAGIARIQQIFATLLLPSILYQEDSCSASEPAFEFLGEVLKYSRASDKGVRLQVCRLICSVLNTVAGMADGDGNISENAWFLLRDHLLPRLRDKHVNVRAAAARAFELLQSDQSEVSPESGSENEECLDEKRDEATLELLRLASGDASKEVRMAATMSFQLSATTLPDLVNRTRDSAHEVRIAAIDRIGKCVLISNLTREVRLSILSRTLSDRNKDVVAKGKWLLLHCWLRHLSFDCSKFFELLSGPMQCSSDPSMLCASMILKAVDRKQSKDDDWLTREDIHSLEQSLAQHASKMRNSNISLLEEDNLSAGDVMLLRLRAERANQLGGVFKEDELESILPDMAPFAELVGECIHNASEASAVYEETSAELSELSAEGMSTTSPLFESARESAEQATKIAEKTQSLALEVLRVVPMLDQQDEAGRSAVVKTLSTALLCESTSDDLLEAAVETMTRLCGSGELVDHLHSLTFEFGVKISSSSEQSEQSWWEYRLCMTIAEALKNMSLGTEVGSEVEGTLMKLLANSESQTRERAVQGLSRLSLLREDYAMKFLPILFNIIVAAGTEVLCVRAYAAQGLVDLMMIYDSVAQIMKGDFASMAAISQLPAATNWLSGYSDDSCVVVELLCWLMEAEGAMAALAAESASKLLLNLKIGDSSDNVGKVLNSLVTIFFSTEIDHESPDLELGTTSRMQQLLTIFFKVYPSRSNYATLRASLSTFINSCLENTDKEEGHHQNVAALSNALLYIDMFDEYEHATKEKKQSRAYVVLELCRALRSSSSTASWAKLARKNLVKVFGSLEVPCLNNQGKVTDVELLKLVALWTEQTAAHLSALDGVASAKPIRKFAASCKDYDPTPDDVLPSELVVSLATKHMQLGEEDEIAILLSDAPINSSASASSISRSSRRSTTKKRTTIESAAEECSTCEEDEPCNVCGKHGDDDKAMLCEGCEGVYHIYCLNPPLSHVPEGDWFCDACQENILPSGDENVDTAMSKEVAMKRESTDRSALKEINA